MLQKTSLFIVDDDELLRETVSDIFTEKGYLVETASTGKEAIQKLEERSFNVVLIDIRLPDIDGIELLKKLKRMHPGTEGIIITGYATLETSIKAVREGAFAYVMKPLQMDEVFDIVEQALEKQHLIMEGVRLLDRERQSKEYYRALSVIDGLTNLYNYRYFREQLGRELALAKRYSNELSFLMADIDDFKDYNDRYGHLAGNRALREIAKTLAKETREGDIVARYGGEEFTIVMPQTGREAAGVAAERLRDIVENARPKPWVTISIGISSFPSDASNDEGLISCADQALYRAKRAGKNRVSFYSEEGI